jgi:hypothetical protein
MPRLRWSGLAIFTIGLGTLVTAGPLALVLWAEEKIRGKEWSSKR